MRQPSLLDLGIPAGDAQVSATFLLLNSQMIGMLLGGIFWGILGDKKGRLSTLFGSIALYPVANIANAFVHGIPAYAAWRFLAGLGLLLLVTRFSLRESGMFRNLGAQEGVTGPVTAGTAVAFCYSGITPGSLASGILSQFWGSRRKVVLLFILGTLAGVATYLTVRGLTPALFYALAGYLGLTAGYWAVFVTIAAEQFGTNLRATVATTVPNFVRGAVPLITGSFTLLLGPMGFIGSAWTVGLVCISLALVSLWGMAETAGRDLDFLE